MTLFQNYKNLFGKRPVLITDRNESVKLSELESINLSIKDKVPKRSLVFALN